MPRLSPPRLPLRRLQRSHLPAPRPRRLDRRLRRSTRRAHGGPVRGREASVGGGGPRATRHQLRQLCAAASCSNTGMAKAPPLSLGMVVFLALSCQRHIEGASEGSQEYRPGDAGWSRRVLYEESGLPAWAAVQEQHVRRSARRREGHRAYPEERLGPRVPCVDRDRPRRRKVVQDPLDSRIWRRYLQVGSLPRGGHASVATRSLKRTAWRH